MTIYFATSNHAKQAELSAILNEGGARWEVKLPAADGLVFAPVEDGASFAENSLIKARALWRLTRQSAVADDSGLCVDALNGRPGIFSARYGEERGLKLDAPQKNAALLAELGGAPCRTARFFCAMTVLISEHRFVTVQETLEGEIALSPQGSGGFGYDPIFFLPEYGLTVAQLPPEVKNTISHRAKAARMLRNILSNAAL